MNIGWSRSAFVALFLSVLVASAAPSASPGPQQRASLGDAVSSLYDLKTGKTETHDIRHIFLMTGAAPCTAWLSGCVAMDADGFVKTGNDLSKEELTAARWPLARNPYLLETTLPGVFAVGDVRSGNVKRVASAVGEGSIAISFVHKALHE